MDKGDIMFFMFGVLIVGGSLFMMGANYHAQNNINGLINKKEAVTYINKHPFKGDVFENIVVTFCKKAIELKIPYSEIREQTNDYCLEYYEKEYKKQEQKELVKHLFDQK